MMFAGLRVEVSRPHTFTIRRTWRERLFSRPWRPHIATETKVLPAIVATDEAYMIGDTLVCGERYYDQLTKEIRHENVC